MRWEKQVLSKYQQKQKKTSNKDFFNARTAKNENKINGKSSNFG